MKLNKEMTNLEIAELMRSVAAAYELEGGDTNRFRIIAYERAADAVEHASSELKDLWDEGKLDEIPGIGKNIAEHLGELFSKGKVKHFDDLMSKLPQNIFELIKVPGIGPKTALKLVVGLGLSKSTHIVKDILKACKNGQVASLEGFGEQSQDEIAKSLSELKDTPKRHLLPYANNIADDVIGWMKNLPAAKSIDTLGSLRRQASTVGDIDIAVASDNPKAVLEHFSKYPKAKRVLEKGERTASILLPGEIQIDIMVQPIKSYGSLLQHFTGSKHHNIALREYAIKKGLSLSEYGIKEVKSKNSKVKSFTDEKSFYRELGLDWIPPELREDGGEIESALNHSLPSLVELSDIKSDLQIHSSFDIETSHDLGLSSMEEIVDKANKLNYEYIALTEHNPSRSGHKEKDFIDLLKRKKEQVDKINYSIVKSKKYRVNHVFNSLEIDIMMDGGCPIPEESFKYLDFVLVAIHSGFKLGRNQMTKRIIDSFNWNPKVKIFAHPTARKLGEREGVEVDWSRIFDLCKTKNKWLEINADPMRLDLPDFLVHEAIKNCVMLTLGTDSHHKDMMDNMVYGVSVARRGWAEATNIVNTRSLEEFTKMLE